MLHRRILFLSAGLIVIVGFGLSLAHTRRQSPPSRVQLEMVTVGMTREEVAQIVGGPPRNYTNGEFSGLAKAFGGDGWVCRDGELIVIFDVNGVATDVKVVSVARVYYPPLFQRVCDMLGLSG